MDFPSTNIYLILQILNTSIYVPLYAVQDNFVSKEKLFLENVRIDWKSIPERIKRHIKCEEEGLEHCIGGINVYKIDGGPSGNSYDEMKDGFVLGMVYRDFSILKTILGKNGSRAGNKNMGMLPDMRVRYIEKRLLKIEIFLHTPVAVVTIITLYLFLSFGLDRNGLSRREIEKIPSHQYSSQNFSNKGCCICLENFEDGNFVRNLSCNHVFHKECVDKWLHKNFVCPICRSKVLPR